MSGPAPSFEPASPAEPFEIGRPPRAWAAVTLLIGGFVALAIVWAAQAEIDELSRAQGRIIPSGRTQIVQSSESGVVAEILVRAGQQVSAGQELVRLDDTPITSSAGEVEARVRALEAQIARLRVEYSAGPDAEYICPPSLAAVAQEICDNEEDLLEVRAQSLEQGKEVLLQRVEQRRRELSEAIANQARIAEALVLAQSNHDIMAPLAEQGLVAQTNFNAVQRELSDLTGQGAAIDEAIARARAALAEAELQVNQANLQFRQEALAEMTGRLAELASAREQLRGASDRVARTDIRSPVDGIVNSLEINTIGAVVQPGTRILDIVPVSATLLVEARLSPTDVAFVVPGQKANIKLTAYDFSIYGGLEGEVQNVSADSIVDPDTRETYYSVLIGTEESGLTYRDQVLPILPGMVTSVEIITGRKTVLQYLLKPINKARDEALRER